MARGEFTAPHALGEHVGSLEKIDRRRVGGINWAEPAIYLPAFKNSGKGRACE